MAYVFDLPSWVSRIQNGGNKLPASTLNDIQRKERSYDATSGQSRPIPIHYGRNRVSSNDYAVTPINTGTHDIYAIVWGWQEYEQIESVYINDALSTSYVGVTVTNYLGTDAQVADPTLVANITGYADALTGVVYSVISIPHGTVTGAPRFACVLKGRKVYDPRTLTTAYSTNSALCLADMISNTVYGEGRTVTNVAECADWCDELVNGVKRCQISIEIKTPRRSRDWSLVLAEYAEAFIIEEGDQVKIRPDRKEASLKFLTDADMQNLNGSVSSTSNAPTVVELRWTKQLVGDAPWPQPVVSRQFPGVGDTVQLVKSSVKMDGLFTEEEANRKAEARLRRGQLASTFTYEGFDHEVLTQVGDVFLILSDIEKIIQLVRVTGVELIRAGRYRVHCARYDDYAYPDSVLPNPTTGQVYDGMIVPMLSGSVPAGWELFSLADGKYLNAGTSLEIGSTGGVATVDLVGTVNEAGLHSGESPFRVRLTSEGGVNEFYPQDNSKISEGAHDHTYSKTGVTVQPYTRETKLIKRNGGATSFFPNNSGVLSNGDINSPDVDQITAHVGRVLKAAADWANSGAQSKIEMITTGLGGQHKHNLSGDTLVPQVPGSNFDYLLADNHNHQLTMTLTPNMLRHRLYLYGGAEDFSVQPGMIVATDSTDSFTGWVDCDGTNDTPDLIGKYIELASSVNIDTTAGDNTVLLSGLTDTKSHQHQGEQLTGGNDPYENVLGYHNDLVPHEHTYSGSVAYTAPYYKLRFLMYTGV